MQYNPLSVREPDKGRPHQHFYRDMCTGMRPKHFCFVVNKATNMIKGPLRSGEGVEASYAVTVQALQAEMDGHD